MSQKNHIKIDSFKIGRMYLNDIPDVLKLAISSQYRFGFTPTASPSLFFREVSLVLQKNTMNSFVFRQENDKIFAAFIISPKTSISAEIIYVFVKDSIIQTAEMQNAFKTELNKLKYSEIIINIMKKRKRFDFFVKLLNSYGFNEIVNENESDLKLIYRKNP